MIKAIKLKKIVFFVSILLIIFVIFYYKIFLFGNNIIKNRSADNIVEILNHFENYCADMEVTVNSNKTENQYHIYQEVKGAVSRQELTDGDNTIEIKLDGNRLTVSNTNLQLEKVYENYNNLFNHAMFLNSFSNDYKAPENETNSYEENGAIILEVTLKNNPNTYIRNKKLYMDGKTLKPTKLEMKDTTKKKTICIVYNNVDIL